MGPLLITGFWAHFVAIQHGAFEDAFPSYRVVIKNCLQRKDHVGSASIKEIPKNHPIHQKFEWDLTNGPLGKFRFSGPFRGSCWRFLGSKYTFRVETERRDSHPTLTVWSNHCK